MKCVVGIDLGSTTTKAILLDENGFILGRGITNSRSNYEVACEIARKEAIISAKFTILEQELIQNSKNNNEILIFNKLLKQAFKQEIYLEELRFLQKTILNFFSDFNKNNKNTALKESVNMILNEMKNSSSKLFNSTNIRKSDFFRDIAGSEFIILSEIASKKQKVSFDSLISLFDKAIIEVETKVQNITFTSALKKVAKQLFNDKKNNNFSSKFKNKLEKKILKIISINIDEVSFVGTGYGRQTLPFPKEAIRSEILCHGKGAHNLFSKTHTVLDIGGQDTKAIQIDENGVVTSFQMNDRCAAGCGRYLGYIADELKLGLHELGPLALKAKKNIKINSTCTVFAGAELRERLAIGEDRRDILAGLHRAIIMRAMSLLARSGGIKNEFTFTGGVCKNPMAVKILKDLVTKNYSNKIKINTHTDSIYTGALGAALFALNDFKKGKPNLLPHLKKQYSNIINNDNSCESCTSKNNCS